MILLVNKGNNQLAIYDSEYYGSESWGSNSQDAIEFKRKNWYITHWNAGSTDFPEDLPDERYAYKLNVIAEFQTIQECQDYLDKNLKYQLEILRQNKISFDKCFQNGYVTAVKQFRVMIKELDEPMFQFRDLTGWKNCKDYTIEDLKKIDFECDQNFMDHYFEYRDII